MPHVCKASMQWMHGTVQGHTSTSVKHLQSALIHAEHLNKLQAQKHRSAAYFLCLPTSATKRCKPLTSSEAFTKAELLSSTRKHQGRQHCRVNQPAPLTAQQVKEIILRSVTRVDHPVLLDKRKVSFTDLCRTGGIVNAYRALGLAGTYQLSK